MMCTTVLHGGVCHRTSTPYESGNKMKEKKKTLLYLSYLIFIDHRCTYLSIVFKIVFKIAALCIFSLIIIHNVFSLPHQPI